MRSYILDLVSSNAMSPLLTFNKFFSFFILIHMLRLLPFRRRNWNCAQTFQLIFIERINISILAVFSMVIEKRCLPVCSACYRVPSPETLFQITKNRHTNKSLFITTLKLKKWKMFFYKIIIFLKIDWVTANSLFSVLQLKKPNKCRQFLHFYFSSDFILFYFHNWWLFNRNMMSHFLLTRGD